MHNNDIHKLSRRIAVHDKYALGAAIQALKYDLFKGRDGICEKIARQYEHSNLRINRMQIDLLKRRMVTYASSIITCGGISEDILKHAYNCTYESLGNNNSVTTSFGSYIATIKNDKNPSILLNFKFSPEIREKLRKLDSPVFDNRTRSWKVKATIKNCEDLLQIGFSFTEELESWYHKHSYKFYPEPSKNIRIRGLKKELLPFQKEGISYVVSRNNRALIADDMGLGKTVQAIGFTQLIAYERPVLVICPSSLKYNWAKEIKEWVKDPSIYVVFGSPDENKSNAQIYDDIYVYRKGVANNNFIIINYDIISNEFKKSKDAEGKTIRTEIKYSKWIDYLKQIDIKCVIIDEAQYIKNKEAARTTAILTLTKDIPNILALSGTPIENKPIEFFTLLNLLNPYQFPNKMEYALQFCNATHNGFGWNFNGSSNLKELHQLVSQSIMIRRLKEEVLKELPPIRRITVDIDIDNRKEYNKAQEDIIAWFRKKGLKKKADAAEKAKALVKINVLLQLSLKGKIKNCIEWIKTYLESGEKLVVFATHTQTLAILLKEFGHVIKDPEGIAVVVEGSTSAKTRQEYVELFQTNDKCKLFLGNLKAAGVGLTLTKAPNTCCVELGMVPGHHLQAESRVHRIGQTADSVCAYYLVARGTIEEEIAHLLCTKNDVLKLTLDGTDINETEELQQQYGMLSDVVQKIIF
jgi:SWI/SNF-related matrix-associated actin-dependent regulator of chromatin subfamily A-like protein 1